MRGYSSDHCTWFGGAPCDEVGWSTLWATCAAVAMGAALALAHKRKPR